MGDLWNNGYPADSCMHDIPLQNGCDGCEETGAFAYHSRRGLLRMQDEMRKMAEGNEPLNYEPAPTIISPAMYSVLYGDDE